MFTIIDYHFFAHLSRGIFLFFEKYFIFYGKIRLFYTKISYLNKKRKKATKKESGKVFPFPLFGHFFIQKRTKKYDFLTIFQSNQNQIKPFPKGKQLLQWLHQRAEHRNRNVRSCGRDGSCIRLRVPTGKSNRLRELRTERCAKNSSRERAVCMPWEGAYRCSCS